MITINDVLVHLGSTCHVIRLNSQHFLQGMRSTVSLECPHLHLTKSLTTKLGFTTQRLLRDKAVRAG